MFDQLTAKEKAVLERIAKNDKELLAKRATIILITNEAASINEIARVVDFTPRTVKRWQQQFAKARLNIFPDTILSEDKPTDIIQTNHSRNYRIGLLSTDPLGEAGRKVLSFHFDRMMCHEPGARLGEDIEELHNMRVAIRRMRSTFEVFGEGFIKKKIKTLVRRLKETARVLGDVRDWDIFIEKFEADQKAMPKHTGLESLLEYCYIRQEQARYKMLTYLDSKKYIDFKESFEQFLNTPSQGIKPIPVDQPVPYQLRHVVSTLIYTRYEQVCAYEPILADASVETLHDLRIASKRLRYTLENFREILGDDGEIVIRQVKELQNHLGDVNDAEIASNFLQDFLDNWKIYRGSLPTAKRKKPKAAKNYLNAKLKERQELIDTFPEAWQRFNSPELKHHLALAIAS
jgi:CHAD domain-containing protein